MWTRTSVAKTIDHSLLRPTMTVSDIIAGCSLARDCGVAAACVRPADVPLARRELAGSGVKVCTVIGFPHGSNRPDVKAAEARLAIDDGAQELDMVMNIGRFLSGEHDLVRRDIEGVVAEAHGRGAIVKVILEVCWLKPDQIAAACRIAESAGADFVKTSTGYGEGPATPQAVEIMVRTVAPRLGVKAAGGIRTFDQAVAYLEQGCARLGVSQTRAILDMAKI